MTEVTSDLLEARHEHLQDGYSVPGMLGPGAEEVKTAGTVMHHVTIALREEVPERSHVCPMTQAENTRSSMQ